MTARDLYENTKTNYTGSHSVAWTWTATPAPDSTPPTKPADGNQTFSSGIATVAGFTLYNAGETPTITATADTKSGISGSIIVNPAALNDFTVVPSTYSPTTDDTFTVTLTARDAYQNTKTNYTGAHSVSWAWATGGNNSPRGSAATLASNGNQTFTLGVASGINGFKVVKTETATIQATADTKSGTSSTITC